MMTLDVNMGTDNKKVKYYSDPWICGNCALYNINTPAVTWKRMRSDILGLCNKCKPRFNTLFGSELTREEVDVMMIIES